MTTTGYLLSVCACFRSFQNEIKLHMHTQTDRYTDTDIYGIDVYKQCSHALHTIGIIAVWLQYTQKRIHIYALCSTVVDGCRRYTCTMCAFALVFSTEPANNGVHVRHRVVYACGNNHIVCSVRREPRCVYVFHVFLCCCCVSCCCVWVECEVCACRHHCICVVCWCSPHSTNSICAWMECGWSVQLRRLWTVRSVQIDGLTLHWFLFLFCVQITRGREVTAVSWNCRCSSIDTNILRMILFSTKCVMLYYYIDRKLKLAWIAKLIIKTLDTHSCVCVWIK